MQDDMMISAGGESIKFKYVKQSLCDWKTWIASKPKVTCTSDLASYIWSVLIYMGL